MSLPPLLERVYSVIELAGCARGYRLKYHRWSDKDVTNKIPFIMLKRAADASSNVLLQQTDVAIQLCDNPDKIEEGEAEMKGIRKLFREPVRVPGVTRFDPIGTLVGPMFLKNGRPLWELTVRCFTEDL